MDRALGARASNRVTLDEAEETNKGQILDAGGGGRARSVAFIPRTMGS